MQYDEKRGSHYKKNFKYINRHWLNSRFVWVYFGVKEISGFGN